MSTESTTPSNPFNDYVFLNATPSERGSFTLATEKALAKLEKFQLPDPSYFVLQWVQALVASGSTAIHIRYNSTTLKGGFELSFSFDGPGYSRLEVESLYDNVFRSGRDRELDRIRELALGWLSACSLNLTKMTLESNGWRRTRDDSTGSYSERTEKAEATELHKLEVVGRGHYNFEEILRRRCSEVPCQLTFDTKPLSLGSSAGGVPWPNRTFHLKTTKGQMGATYGGAAASQISFLRYGVEFVNRPEPSLQPPVILRVSDNTLSKNVSQTDVVKDEAYDQFLGRLRSEMKRMGLELTRKRIPSYQREALNTFIQSYLVSFIDVRAFEDPERLKLMGDQFSDLIKFPLFKMAGGGYLSTEDLRKEYNTKGYLLYSLDLRTQLARWDGILLVLSVDEVSVLKKYFSNMMALSHEDVRMLCRGGVGVIAEARRRPIVCQTPYQGFSGGLNIAVKVPDVYPTGEAIVVKGEQTRGSRLPGLKATLILQVPKGIELSSNDMAQLKVSLAPVLKELVTQLAFRLNAPDISQNQSRMRLAELTCEYLLCLRKLREISDSIPLSKEMGEQVTGAPIIGLENGALISIDDLQNFVRIQGSVYVGGAFVEGLDSGALDPMPCALELVQEMLHPSEIKSTDSIRDRLHKDPELSFELRRQTIMPGLAKNPLPEMAFRNFANEAAAQAAEMERIEKEYKAALSGQKLFVKPDEDRLTQLAEEVAEREFELDSLETTVDPPSAEQISPSQTPTQALIPPPLPCLNTDLQSLRDQMGDFCSTPGAIHVERREQLFSLHLSLTWERSECCGVHLLKGENRAELKHDLAIEGFVRLCPTADIEAQDILDDAVEQLVLKCIDTLKKDPAQPHHRRRLRNWLLQSCRLMTHWKSNSAVIARELTRLPLVPCLGGRYLSWMQLLVQARTLGHTPVADPGERNQVGDAIYDVIKLENDWLDELLESLNFPRKMNWRRAKREVDFDLLLKNAWKEMTSVVNGHQEDLLDQDLIGKLATEAGFWTRWRAGFLSWDAHAEKALVNPNHKLGQKLLKKYIPDPSWAAILASALFSTINRGLKEVEDHHEEAFLQGMLDSLE